jgi:hypothetical protein
MRILTLHATVALVPADVQPVRRAVPAPLAPAPAPAPAPMPSPTWDSTAWPATAGHGLADARRTLDEGARLLADVHRDGA